MIVTIALKYPSLIFRQECEGCRFVNDGCLDDIPNRIISCSRNWTYIPLLQGLLLHGNFEATYWQGRGGQHLWKQWFNRCTLTYEHAFSGIVLKALALARMCGDKTQAGSCIYIKYSLKIPVTLLVAKKSRMAILRHSSGLAVLIYLFTSVKIDNMIVWLKLKIVIT